MAEVNPQLVKQLRERTNAGLRAAPSIRSVMIVRRFAAARSSSLPT